MLRSAARSAPTSLTGRPWVGVVYGSDLKWACCYPAFPVSEVALFYCYDPLTRLVVVVDFGYPNLVSEVDLTGFEYCIP